jgi:hypothetical protein
MYSTLLERLHGEIPAHESRVTINSEDILLPWSERIKAGKLSTEHVVVDHRNVRGEPGFSYKVAG